MVEEVKILHHFKLMTFCYEILPKRTVNYFHIRTFACGYDSLFQMARIIRSSDADDSYHAYGSHHMSDEEYECEHYDPRSGRS